MNRTLASRLVAASALMLGGCAKHAGPGFEQSDAIADYHYVIPEGTGDRMDRGEPVDILPLELDVHVGETIRIENHDHRTHAIGPFSVGAGQTLAQRFASAGTLQGVCTVHPDGKLTLVVRE